MRDEVDHRRQIIQVKIVNGMMCIGVLNPSLDTCSIQLSKSTNTLQDPLLLALEHVQWLIKNLSTSANRVIILMSAYLRIT